MIRISSRIDIPRTKAVRDLLGNPKEVMAEIAESLMAGIRQQVRTRGSRFGGEKWPEYAPLSLYSKRIRGPKGRMLEGLLRHISARSGVTFAEVSSDSEIVTYHDKGTKGPYPIPKKAKKGKFISFPSPMGTPMMGRAGKWFTTDRGVNHPGLKQRRVFPTPDEAGDIAVTIFSRRIKEVIK